MARQPGPNDFHYAPNEAGVLTMQPGLGKDEPPDITKDQLRRDALANYERQQLLDKQARENADLAAELEEKDKQLDTREAELQRMAAEIRRQKKELEEAQAAQARVAKLAPQATDRERGKAE